jgi:hypothetical protein
MKMKHAIKVVAASLIFVSLGLQAYILVFVLAELFTVGHTGFASALGYGASLTFSVPAYFLALTLTYCAGIRLPLKWVNGTYFGSHLIILGCMFAFPGKFA